MAAMSLSRRWFADDRASRERDQCGMTDGQSLA
jgi:hypothetical protein